MTTLQNEVFNTIRMMQLEKLAGRRVPDHILLIADMPHRRANLSLVDFREVVAELEESGLLHTGWTATDDYVRVAGINEDNTIESSL